MKLNKRRINTKDLPPKEAWDTFVDMEEAKFIAFMRPTTSIEEMCRICASELPIVRPHRSY